MAAKDVKFGADAREHMLMALLGAAPLLGACNTTAGAGKDISKVGDKIEEEAVEHTP